MNKSVRVLIFICVLGLACSAGAMIMVLLNQRQQQPGELSVRDYGLKIIPFQLVDQDGNAADESSLRGQWTVVNFMFTNCVGICPVMTARISDAAELLQGTPVRFASFSLDSKRDTPERMREFAEAYRVDHDRWAFYTGDDTQTRKMVSDGLKLIVDDENTNELTLEDGSTMKNILHPTRFFLVNPDLEVVGLYSSGDPSEVDRLVREVTAFMSGE
ncbi:MAG: hypothetical protein COB69_08260 [Phycisphaera sp.]|nr:MAG: hypothetical protein COB69_08260 [Phycisphaera sp.]